MTGVEGLHDRPLVRMPYETAQTPHLVIEVNQACNITCQACYKVRAGANKPLEQVLAEIDWALQQRRLDVVTLAGGEPTLHPDLPRIVGYLRERGILVQMLTNGTRLTDERLEELARAGMFKVYLHVDARQRRPDVQEADGEAGLGELRERIARRVRGHGIRCAAVITLYRSDLPELDRIVQQVLASPSLDWLLATLYTDFTGLAEQLGLQGTRDLLGEGLVDQEVTNEQVADHLREHFGWWPSAYVASSRRLDEKRWIFYYALLLRRGDEVVDVFHFDHRFGRNIALGNWMYRRVRGRYPFDILLGQAAIVAVALAHAVLCLDPRRALQILRFLGGLRPGRTLEFKALCFQQGPNPTGDGGVEICRFCPDATVRDNRLVPVCLVDVLMPPGEDLSPAQQERVTQLIDGLWS